MYSTMLGGRDVCVCGGGGEGVKGGGVTMGGCRVSEA